jgi:hypothetical protein
MFPLHRIQCKSARRRESLGRARDQMTKKIPLPERWLLRLAAKGKLGTEEYAQMPNRIAPELWCRGVTSLLVSMTSIVAPLLPR